MSHFVNVILVCVITISVLMFDMAKEYVVNGHGLHPAAAFGVALAGIIAGSIVIHSFYQTKE